MPRPSFQFRLSTLLWITLAVACWFGGMMVERRRLDDLAVDDIQYAVPLGPSISKEAAALLKLKGKSSLSRPPRRPSWRSSCSRS